MRARLCSGLFLLLSVFAISAAGAAADRFNVDFESGPALPTPVQDNCLASAFVSFPEVPVRRPCAVATQSSVFASPA